MVLFLWCILFLYIRGCCCCFFCHNVTFLFLQVLVEHAGRWKTDEDPLPLLEVYTVAILNFAKAASCLSPECENVPLLLEKLALWVQDSPL